eukprot:COSAG02_NODE_4278_length_5555_cov_5.837243_3_plen_86_part_00
MSLHACTRADFAKNAAAGLGVMLVGKGGAADEGGGDSACSSAELQLVGILRRGKCSGAAAATGWEGRTGGTRSYLERSRLLRLKK